MQTVPPATSTPILAEEGPEMTTDTPNLGAVLYNHLCDHNYDTAARLIVDAEGARKPYWDRVSVVRELLGAVEQAAKEDDSTWVLTED